MLPIKTIKYGKMRTKIWSSNTSICCRARFILDTMLPVKVFAKKLSGRRYTWEKTSSIKDLNILVSKEL